MTLISSSWCGFRWSRLAGRRSTTKTLEPGGNKETKVELAQHVVMSVEKQHILSLKYTIKWHNKKLNKKPFTKTAAHIYKHTHAHAHTHTTPVCDCTVDFTPSCTNTESSLSKIAQRSNDQTETVALWLWEGLLNCPSISRQIPLTHILRHQANGGTAPYRSVGRRHFVITRERIPRFKLVWKG